MEGEQACSFVGYLVRSNYSLQQRHPRSLLYCSLLWLRRGGYRVTWMRQTLMFCSGLHLHIVTESTQATLQLHKAGSTASEEGVLVVCSKAEDEILL